MRWETVARRVSLGGAAVIVLTGLQLRVKASQLRTVEPTDEDPESDYVVIAAAGVELDDATRRAAINYARNEGLDVLDLIPADLAVERAVEVLRWTKPATFRRDRLALNRGPARALVLSADVAKRAELDGVASLEPAQFARAAEIAKKFAPTSSDFAVAPGLRDRGLDPVDHARLLYAVLDFGARPYLAVEAITAALLGWAAVAGLRRRRPALAAPLVAYSLHPLLGFAGTPLRPTDLVSSIVGRWPRRVARLGPMLRASADFGEEVARDEGLRVIYDQLLADGTERYFEPRRSDCPLCGHTGLSEIVRTQELLQCKPGTFVIERCDACGHVFQNPRLSVEGLAFYYRDYYEGIGGRPVELLFGTQTRSFRARAEMLRGLAHPRRWIDVGADRGQFCLIAQESWPETEFHGLDMSAGIDEAATRGWVDRAFRGMLPDLAPQLAGTYDVVTMHHYLEHTREPEAELDAATTLLRPGGHLSIEVPDPEFPLARLFGGLWGSYLPAQHLHLLSIGNLERLLRDRGYEIVRRQRGRAHVLGADFAWAAYLVLQKLAPPTQFPWRPRPTRRARLRRTVAFGIAAPILVAALVLDGLLSGVARLSGRSNAYRVVARLREGDRPAEHLLATGGQELPGR